MPGIRFLTRTAALLAFVSSSLFAGCGDNGGAQGKATPQVNQTKDGLVGTWVGKVEGSDAFIGINVYENRDVMAYVCDGQTISQWFLGENAGKDSFVATRDNGARLQAKLTKEEATGTVTLAGGRPLEFKARRATGDAGLYRGSVSVNGVKSLAGWVVLADGALRGAVQSGTQILSGGQLNTSTGTATTALGAAQGRLVNPFFLREIDF